MTITTRPHHQDRPAGRTTAGLAVEVRPADEAALLQYRADCGSASFRPPQSPDWIEAWVRHATLDCFILRVTTGGAHHLSLACEIVPKGPFRIARFIGDSHANGNFPALSQAVPQADAAALAGAIAQGLRQERPDIDLLMLERQVRDNAGLENPFLGMRHHRSPNVALAVDLKGGFDAVLSRASGKRKRKQYRSQARKFEAAGGHRRHQAASRAEADAMLDAFFAMKRVRFAKMGISDVFAPQAVQRAFRDLFGAAAETAEPAFVLHGLEIDGRLRAVTGASRTAERLICEFSAISEDALSEASPGAFLFYENIEDACTEGLSVYDFSVGDEYYKRLWCDLETSHFDTLIPLSAKGRVLAGLHAATTGAKRYVNASPRLWTIVKRLRRWLAPLRGKSA
ncbi:GNAT family N-acetyltransferase [Nitratireductor sp. ZSWI3]|uniref:GNAT family N-acetyltransferase n=1 Tax=Nitratireductor sp. ZSWI3 TaxID=2966359 RepID=UPI00214FC24D|nr:GNAT family N-acetyltransferase [Nitratireductor sp. ZSWI3]MCR4266034.1 GNAT family N-acetyltransferase [Nitratireductor sp. ZSWI3]